MDKNGNPTEDELQVYSADVIRAFGVPGVVAYHIPNQRKAKVQYLVKLKAMGVRKGAADWGFVLPGGRAAFIEIKKHNGEQRQAQRDFQRDVRASGALYEVAHTPEEIDGVLSAFGVINKPIRESQPRQRASGGRSGEGTGNAYPSPKPRKVAA